MNIKITRRQNFIFNDGLFYQLTTPPRPWRSLEYHSPVRESVHEFGLTDRGTGIKKFHNTVRGLHGYHNHEFNFSSNIYGSREEDFTSFHNIVKLTPP